MKKITKVIMLATDKATYHDNNANQLSTHRKKGFLQLCKGFDKEIEESFQPQHLYFITDEEIKEGDYRYSTIQNNVALANTVDLKTGYYKDNYAYNKVIATTNPELQLPLIPQDFIEYYVQQQGNVSEVEYELESVGPGFHAWYEVIWSIPQSNPLQQVLVLAEQMYKGAETYDDRNVYYQDGLLAGMNKIIKLIKRELDK